MIGITEAGDPSICLEWVDKINTVDGIILITKSPGSFINSSLEDEIEKIKNRLIIHCTITGYGKTVLEPNVSPYNISVMMMVELIKRGYNVVLRIDPIVPTVKGFERMKAVIAYTKSLLGTLKDLRIKWSIIDNYKHLKDRGITLPWSSFNCPSESSDETLWVGSNKIIAYFNHLQEIEGCIIETCAESYNNIPQHWKVGCVSTTDLAIMKLPILEEYGKSNQRKACNCINEKIELLDKKEQCAYECKYCYWKTAHNKDI